MTSLPGFLLYDVTEVYSSRSSLTQFMAMPEERRKRGLDVIKRYLASAGGDKYAAAADAISDILLSVAETEDEGLQLLRTAEMEFRNALEGESFATEG